MPIKNPEEVRNAETVDVDPKKLATKHSDEKFEFPKSSDGSTETSDSPENDKTE